MAGIHRDDRRHQHQLNLFPLHPESLVEDKDHIHEDNVAFLFDSEPGATLNSLLAGASCSEEDHLSALPSLTYANSGQDNEHELGDIVVGGKSSNSSTSASSKLVRAAMRNKEREPSEEKWVCYSELLVEKKEVEEVMSSCAAEVWCPKRTPRKMQEGLSLKLDYEGILNAWSDKGPLLIAEEFPPQTVPDLHDYYQQQPLVHDSANVLVESWGSVYNANECAVPEMVGSLKVMMIKMEEEDHEEGKDNTNGWKKMRQIMMREASVSRYKEKRQNRLFSKRIRYEVRRLNAEKRPRIKGRFVKIIRS